MPQEQPKQYSEEEIKEMEKARDRVKGLGNPMYDLAERDSQFRHKLEKRGLTGEVADELAEMYSDETLEKMEAQEEQVIDGLTGLRSRKALDVDIPRILSQENKAKSKCCLLMIDVDEFKEINDTYGHQSGDEALKNVANVLKKSCRETDVIYRYAGDEFTIFLPNSDTEGVKVMLERIRDNLNEVNKESKFNIALSIGISSVDYLKEDKDKDKLIKEADVALYHVKRSGRNGSLEYKAEMKDKNN